MNGSGEILVVEDDEASRRLVGAVLRPGGYAIREAADNAAAREFLRTHTPALVLLDVRLKGEDGLDLLRIIRDDPRLREVPVIAITAQAMKTDRERILRAGCNDYLPKPIDTRALRARVALLLGREAADAR